MGVQVIGYVAAAAWLSPIDVAAIAIVSTRPIPIPIRKSPVGMPRRSSKIQTLFLGTNRFIGLEGSPLE